MDARLRAPAVTPRAWRRSLWLAMRLYQARGRPRHSSESKRGELAAALRAPSRKKARTSVLGRVVDYLHAEFDRK